MKRLGSATLASLLVACLTATSASAADITPNTTTDDITNNGNCTLREAVQAANTDTAVDQCPAGKGGDVIQLGALTYDLGLTGAKEDGNQTGDLDVTSPLTIQGQGAGATTIDAHSIDRAIDVLPGGTTEIKNLTITNGAAPTSGTFATGGAGENGGAVRSQFVLALTGVAITNSHAGSGATGAAVSLDGNAGGDGGGVWSSFPLEITGGSFESDHAGAGSTGLGGLPASPGDGNPGHAGGDGGAGGSGGAIAIAIGAKVQLTITGTTFQSVIAGRGGDGGDGSAGTGSSSGTGGAGGAAGNGGAGGFGGAISTNGPLTLTNVTSNSTFAGTGGDGGKGGKGGSGATSAQDGQQGKNGNGGAGAAGGAISGDEGALTISGATISRTFAGNGGSAPRDVGASAQGGVPGKGGAGGAIDGGDITVDQSAISDAHGGRGGTGATFLGAKPPLAGNGGSGGGIAGSAVTVSDSTITGATGGQGGGGGSTVTHSVGDGGAGGGGGGVFAANGLTLTNVTLDHDSGGPGGNAGNRGGTVDGSQGGGGGNGGGVLDLQGGTLTNVTFDADASGAGGVGSDNDAGGQGGNGGAIDAGGPLGVSHVTIADSNPGAAGPPRIPAAPPGQPGVAGGIFGPAQVSDSVIAGNTAPQCSGTTDGGGNVSFPDNSCGGVNADPKLHALADNGGMTKTMLLGAGSAAVDTHACSGSDQRGVTRPQGPSCDSGAVEAANFALFANGLDFGKVSQGGTATRTTTVHTTFDPLTPQASLSDPDFSLVSDGCSGVALAPAAACDIQVKFTAPTAPLGPHFATLHLTHDAAGPASDIQLSVIVIDTAPPVLGGLTLAHKTFAVAKRKPAPKGTTIRFSLSEAASVKFAVTQKRPGRRKGTRCVAPTKKLRHAKRCTRTITLGSFTRSASAGRSNVPFNGRVGGRKLKPGTYKLTAAPTDLSGNRGAPASVAFKIVRR